MGVMSGKLGTAAVGPSGVMGATTLRNWRITETIESKTFVASNTKMGTGRRPGVLDWTGSFQQYGYFPFIMPGDKGIFHGFQGPTSGVPGTAGRILSAPYICDNISHVLNWGAADLQQINTSILSDGALVNEPGAGIVDDSNPSTVPSGEGHVEIALATVGGPPPTYVPFCATQATFNLLVQMHPYSNSCGYDIAKKAMVRKRETGAVDWNLAIVSDDIDFYNDGAFPVGSYVQVKLFVTPTLFYELWYGIIESYTDFVVNPETSELISYTINILMTADKDGEVPPGSAVDGKIALPGIATPWWPVSELAMLEAFNAERAALLKTMMPKGKELVA
jgi:hypothetical protein